MFIVVSHGVEYVLQQLVVVKVFVFVNVFVTEEVVVVLVVV